MQQRFLLQFLLLDQHVSSTTMSIIKSSRLLYCSILQTGHITLSSTPDQQLENHNTKYHRQQPLYDTLELLMMGIVVPETSVVSSWHFISTIYNYCFISQQFTVCRFNSFCGAPFEKLKASMYRTRDFVIFVTTFPQLVFILNI